MVLPEIKLVKGNSFDPSYSATALLAERLCCLADKERTTRENAVRIGQKLMDCQIIQLVLDEQPFLNSHLLYRFTMDVMLAIRANPVHNDVA